MFDLKHFDRKVENQNLVWADEFAYVGLPSAKKWEYCIGGDGWGNNELQYYTNGRLENAEVRNGRLIIRSQKEEFNMHDFTSARLISKETWKYGRFEIRAKLPLARGVWPAIWLLPVNFNGMNWPMCGEIDIMEYFGHTYGIVESSLHSEKYNFCGYNKFNKKTNLDKYISEFNVYTLDWTEEKIEFAINDNIVLSAEKKECLGGGHDEWPFDEYYHLIINLAVGGNHAGKYGIDIESWPQEFEIDYVRIYQ